MRIQEPDDSRNGPSSFQRTITEFLWPNQGISPILRRRSLDRWQRDIMVNLEYHHAGIVSESFLPAFAGLRNTTRS